MRILTLLIALALSTSTAAEVAEDVTRLRLPDGLQLSVLADAVPNARQMALDEQRQLLYVGTRRRGVVYRVALGTGQTDIIAEGLTMPSGLALDDDGRLFVGALNEIRIFDEPHTLAGPDEGRLLTDALPRKRHHGWKYLRFGPDRQLYLSVGAPCNVCLEEDERFASVLRMDPANGKTEVIAHGVRNSVGLAFHPTTERLWFTDNGRDRLGDDVPHEELNELVNEGAHYGFPFEHAGPFRDPKFGRDVGDRTFVQPRLNIQAHSAALGLAFARPNTLGGGFEGALFIAEHGSWNRSAKVGYRVSVVRESEGELTYAPFIEGWLQGEDNWGRPNDVLVTGDGALLISDDQAGVIYKVTASEVDNH